MPKFDDFEPIPQIAQRSNKKCAAHDCPLWGTSTFSTNGSETWYCRFHFRADSDNWGKITSRIKNMLGELREYDHLKSVNPYNPELPKRAFDNYMFIRSGVKR